MESSTLYTNPPSLRIGKQFFRHVDNIKMAAGVILSS